MRSVAFPWQNYVYLELCSVINRWDFSFVHHFWLAKLFFFFFFFSKCLHVNKRGELNDERNASKIKTVDELESSRFGTKLTLQKRASARDGRRGGGGGGGDFISAIKEATS